MMSQMCYLSCGQVSHLDGWADLIEDKGEKAQEVKQLVYQYLIERNMPDITVEQREGIARIIGSSKRPYNITQTHPGATIAIYVGQHGKDLYVSWRAFIKRVLHPRLYIALAIAAIVGFFAFVYVLRRMTTGFFAFMPGSGSFVSAFFMALGVTIGVLFIEYLALWWGGYYLRGGDSSAFFYVKPTRFDSDDITAMMLAAHKSLLRALDKVGVDTSQLRLKQQFKGGSSDESV